MLLACPQKLLNVAWLLGAWFASTCIHTPCSGHAMLKWQLSVYVESSRWYLGHACREAQCMAVGLCVLR